jgi:hypothetical protein
MLMPVTAFALFYLIPGSNIGIVVRDELVSVKVTDYLMYLPALLFSLIGFCPALPAAVL